MNLTVSSLSELWDFWSVKLAALAGILGTVGIAWPSLPPSMTSGLPECCGRVCQFCALLITLGIIPARAVKQTKVGG